MRKSFEKSRPEPEFYDSHTFGSRGGVQMLKTGGAKKHLRYP